ncbi:hypothetical protein [Bacteroides thetaiotaomicron]|uniref:hypothetical protein n=1 Tax=Bacteroides thetaiotaomicron TaxID=818 RepID=UPI0039C2E7D5
MAIPIIKNNITLTPYKFYNDFLGDVADYYRSNNPKPIEFRLIDSNDEEAFWGKYRIDPIVIPLLLSIGKQLKDFHGQSLNLHLFNNRGTIALLEFLFKCDFFYIAGDNINPTFPFGKKIFSFNRSYLGGFQGQNFRKEHKLRSYALTDEALIGNIDSFESDEAQRDYLIEHFTYKVRDHFSDLLFDNEYTYNLHNLFIDILSELIANGVMHSGSNVFALMFVDRFKTKFSISDNGIGFKESLAKKENTYFYQYGKLTNRINTCDFNSQIPEKIKADLYAIFEALYYSMLKDRSGLFDLMCNVVLKCKGYFRLHTENAQVIISNRMESELAQLYDIRNTILMLHRNYEHNKIDKKEYINLIIEYSDKSLQSFIDFFANLLRKFNKDIIYSSIRINRVVFRGVHIEVEIPNIESHDSF